MLYLTQACYLLSSPDTDLQHLRTLGGKVIYWWFSKKYLRSVIRKVQEQYCGFIMKKLNLTKVVSSVAEGAGISFKMDRDRGKWWKQNKKQFNLLFGLLYNIHHISVYSSKNNHSLSKCLLIGGYTQLQDLSDVQDDMSDVFRTTIIKIKGDAIKTSDKI